MKRVTRDEYKNNDVTTVTVVNKQKLDDGRLVGYEPTVTIAVKVPFQKAPLEFQNEDEIGDFIGTIDVDNPQQALL